jgi:hypothetical protein
MNGEYRELRFSKSAQEVMDRLKEMYPFGYQLLDLLVKDGIEIYDLRERLDKEVEMFNRIYEEYKYKPEKE